MTLPGQQEEGKSPQLPPLYSASPSMPVQDLQAEPEVHVGDTHARRAVITGVFGSDQTASQLLD